MKVAAAVSSMPGIAEATRGARGDLDRIAERPAQHVDVVDRVLDHRSAARVRDIAAPGRAVEALHREVLVVAHHRREHAAVLARRDRAREFAEHRRPPQHETRPDAERARARPRPASAVARSGASGFSQKIGETAVGRGLDRGEVRGGPGAHPDDVDLVEQPLERVVRLAAVMARDLGRPRRDRRRTSRSAARRSARRRRAVAARPRAPCRCGRSRRARSGSSCSPVARRRVRGFDQRRRTDGPRAEPVAHLVDGALDRGPALGALAPVALARRR